MAKLKAKGLKWLKGFHLIAVASWVGGAVALILLYFLKSISTLTLSAPANEFNTRAQCMQKLNTC